MEKTTEHSVKLPQVAVLEGRQDFLVERCQRKRVLHIGCVDSGLVATRFHEGKLMHQRLAAVSSELWGIDIDAGGIAFLREHGFENLLCADLCDLSPQQWELLRAHSFDVIVVPEVVEHLMNPGRFLDAARALMAGGKCQFIVTVPNAFRLDTLIGLFRGVENVNPDHNYWFSYHTATSILRKAGFSPDEVYLYAYENSAVLKRWNRQRPEGRGPWTEGNAAQPPREVAASPRGSQGRSLQHRILAWLLYRYSPFWADGLILVSTLGGQ